jgi:hypothetical protein
MDKTRDRLTGVTAAVLLQMGFIAIFIYSLPLMAPPKKLPREITFFLPRLREAPEPNPEPNPKPNPSPQRIRPSASLPIPTAPSITLPPVNAPSITLAPPDLQTLGKELFGCAPENRAKLTPQERARCSGLPAPPGTATTEPPSLVKDLPRREAELAAKNTPARVPCVSIRSQALIGQQDTGFMANPLCLLNGWINGFGGLPP